jgi:transcriptional regulator with XRE-family HTH domain
MRFGTKIKELRKRKGLTQIELSERTGLTERTIQRIENHEVEPSKHSLKKMGEVLGHNLNEQKLNNMTKKQRLLNIFIISISILIVVEFIIGWLTWEEHWWVLIGWSIPILGGVSIPYFKKKSKPITLNQQKNLGILISLILGGLLVSIGILIS